jgi:hypothetical protein
MIGWGELPPVNPYATAEQDGTSALGGFATAGASVLPIRATATFEPDLRTAAFTVDFIPVSQGIRTASNDLFIAPLGRRLEWKVVYTVRNPNDVPMTQVKVRDEYGTALRATLAGRPAGKAMIETGDTKGLLQFRDAFVWNVGDLGPGEAARAEVTVVTARDADGRLQFSAPGVYYIDAGAQLAYLLLGKAGTRNAPCGSVIARQNPDEVRGDRGAYDLLVSPIVGDWTSPTPSPIPLPGPGILESMQAGKGLPVIVRADGNMGAKDISRVDSRFTVAAAAKTANISEDTTTSEFLIPPGEYGEWEVTVSIVNTTESNWHKLEMLLVFGTELSADEVAGSKFIRLPSGNPAAGSDTLGITRGADGRVRVTWGWNSTGAANDLPPGSSAGLKLKVYTTSSTGYGAAGSYEFLQSESLRYWPRSGGGAPTIELSGINLRVEETGYADISLSSSRVDWRVAKPGTYATLATTISFTGNGRLSMDFEGFGDLTSSTGGTSVINAYYGFGTDLTDVELSGWIGANALNSDPVAPIALSPTAPATLKMWAKISAGEEDSSAEYENTGVITFTASNN